MRPSCPPPARTTPQQVASWIGRAFDYMASADPRIALSNKAAILVAGNQPFYPLYLYLLVGAGAWPSLLTFLSTPFFLAVPALSRRWPIVGRATLVLAGIANTLLCVVLFGSASGVAAFYLPCGVIAILTFGRSEWIPRSALAALSAFAYLALRDFPPLAGGFTADQSHSIMWVNAVSAFSLTAFVLFQGWRSRLSKDGPVA